MSTLCASQPCGRCLPYLIVVATLLISSTAWSQAVSAEAAEPATEPAEPVAEPASAKSAEVGSHESGPLEPESAGSGAVTSESAGSGAAFESAKTSTAQHETAPPLSFSQGGRPKILWPSRYRRYNWVDGAVSLTFGATAVTAAIIGPKQEGIYGGWWIDEDVRDALRADEWRGRMQARDFSDVLLALGISYAFIVDPLVNATWLHESPDVARQIALLNFEVAAVTLGIHQLTANLVSRERPYVRICGTEELDERTFDCQGDDRNRSHFSGHTASTFAVAAATCTHHTHLPLSGRHAWIPCVTGFAAATTTGLLRIVGDKHYLTDVIAGASIGTLVGWGIPFLHYTTGWKPVGAKVGDVSMTVVPWAGGASIVGVMP